VNKEKEQTDSIESPDRVQVFHRPVIVAVIIAWVVLFLSVLALAQVSKERDVSPDDTKNSLVISEPFSLQNAPATSIRIHSSVPLRVEDDGLAILDVGGLEQSFIQYPYRFPSLFEVGDALMIVPRNGTEIMLVLPDLTTRELSVEEVVQCGDYRDGYVLTLGLAANNIIHVSLYHLTQLAPLLKIPISEQGRPIRVAFAKSGKCFDVLLVDFSEGKPVTRVQRFNFSGELISDRRFEDYGFLPAILQLNEEEQVLFSECELVEVYLETGETRLSRSFDQIMQTELRSSCLGIRAFDGGRISLWFLRESPSRIDRELVEVESEEELIDFALSSDGVYALGVTENGLTLFDTMTGKLVAEQRDGLTGIIKVLTLTERDFLVLTEEEGAIVSIR